MTESGAPPLQPIVYAKAREGLDLPVIDITNPEFAVPDDPESFERQCEAFLELHKAHLRSPQLLTKFFLYLAARRSPLIRALFGSGKAYLDSLSTYILKLGVKYLPPGFDGPVDRKIAGSPHVLLLRLRMQQIATLLAEALVIPLTQDAGAPLHLINIAGGPALDSSNTLLALNRKQPALLKRRIVIHVLDLQTDGEEFGRNAILALMAPNGPLHGLDIQFDQQRYDWNDTAILSGHVSKLASAKAIIGASSEGGLFEYGSDDAIIANLKALADGGVDAVAGSVTDSSDMRKRMIAQTKFKLYPRGIEGFRPLVASAGYIIAESRRAVLSDQVLLQLKA